MNFYRESAKKVENAKIKITIEWPALNKFAFVWFFLVVESFKFAFIMCFFYTFKFYDKNYFVKHPPNAMKFRTTLKKDEQIPRFQCN